jgi:ABC-type Fe3+-hydroxamate transport system substrate-binding protein
MIERTDDLGAVVRLQAPAQSIVSLVPSITETLFAFGAGSQVVGITDYCVHPRQGVATKTRVGGTKNVVVERILELKPDLVIANVEENRKHQIEKLREARISVFVTFPKTVGQCLKMMADMAALTGKAEAARPVMDLIEHARAEARLRASESPPAVFCPIWKDPFMSINRDTFVHSIIQEAGGRNIFEDSPDRYPRLTLDEVARKRPEIIILPTEPYHFREADKNDFRSLGKDVPAVRDDRIQIVEGELLSWYGPRVARALKLLSVLFNSG